MFYASVLTFFSLFSIVFSTLISENIEVSFGWAEGQILVIFGIIGIGALFAIVPRYLADRYGRKPFVLLFAMISTSALIGSNFSFNTPIFILLRIVAGIFGINLATILISEEVPARHRGKAIGVITGIGMTSSLLAAYLLRYAGPLDMWRYLYSIVSFIGLLIICALWFKLKETRRFVRLKGKERLSHSIFKPLKRKYLKILLLSGLTLFLTTWIYFTIKYYFRFFFKYDRGDFIHEAELGLWMMPIFIGSIIGYYSAGYLSDKIGRKKSIYITVNIYFIASIFFLTTLNKTLIFISFFVINISFAIFRLIAEILAVEFFQTDVRAAGSGWVFTFAALAGVVGNFVMKFLKDTLGSWGLMFFIVGTSCLIALLIVTSFIPETKQRVVEEIYMTEIEKV